ncbi:MAG: hypothetical protein O9284_16330 [Steroidobacteraceae bacterium]|nr:hypothetical protein [Steroidobacteraceae bacterium]
MFREYYGRAADTAASFEGDWLRTGDVGIAERSCVRIMGRRSVATIKSGGCKLSALKTESLLLENPAIAECAVVGAPDETSGEVVAAVVVARGGAIVLSLDELRDWCRERPSPYKLPRRLEVVGTLPRNAMGRVMKPAVAAMLISG